MSAHQWDLPDGDDIQPCMRQGCTIQKRTNAASLFEWRRGTRGVWRAGFTIPNCKGAPVAEAPKPVAREEWRSEPPASLKGPCASCGRHYDDNAGSCNDCPWLSWQRAQSKAAPPAPGRMTDEEKKVLFGQNAATINR